VILDQAKENAFDDLYADLVSDYQDSPTVESPALSIHQASHYQDKSEEKRPMSKVEASHGKAFDDLLAELCDITENQEFVSQ
jgi:hypothetical protein